MSESGYSNILKQAADLANFQHSDNATLSFWGELKQFKLIITHKHEGLGLFASTDASLGKPPNPDPEPSPGPQPAEGKFSYNSWDEVMGTVELSFNATNSNGFSIVFSNGDKVVGKYEGGSDGMQGGDGTFKWVM